MNDIEKAAIKKKIVGYCIGFVLSLICTFVAFWITYQATHGADLMITNGAVIIILAILAFGQFVIQLVYFLHLGIETKPRWKLLVFWFMIVIVLILVVGSLWIMQNLNYNMMGDSNDARMFMNKNQGF